MNESDTFDKIIYAGIVSRFIKSTFIQKNGVVSSTAFDLREMTPPETYVSFFMTSGGSDDERFVDANTIISSKLKTSKTDSIALLDIQNCLQEVNDEEENIIEFKEKKLPHCGLTYISNDLTKILEAKTTLCFLAKSRLRDISNILCCKCIDSNI